METVEQEMITDTYQRKKMITNTITTKKLYNTQPLKFKVSTLNVGDT